MLNVQDINVYYGNIHAIKDVSFHVDPGEIVTLIGANGAGKSTILKTISGLLSTKPARSILTAGTSAPRPLTKSSAWAWPMFPKAGGSS